MKQNKKASLKKEIEALKKKNTKLEQEIEFMKKVIEINKKAIRSK
ncbi:hypothetical protein [uncultured Catenibacterium sp.]|nr:hypothetical protein [uncultured Catenibacterium sp.]